MSNARKLNAAVTAGRARAETHMPALEAAYARMLRKGGRESAANFKQQVLTTGTTTPPSALTADSSTWEPPTGDLVPDDLQEQALPILGPVHRKILHAVAPHGDLGIEFDIKHPTSTSLLAGIGKRLGSLSDAIRTQVNEIVARGHDSGWSVDRTAEAIIEKVDEVTPGRAAMLARSDLNSLSNGASFSAAQTVGVSEKTWLATNDDRTRETHAEADGQVVPTDQPFTVGGEQALYPGDPQLSDSEAASCRCTLTYGGDLTASTTPEGGEMTDHEPITATSGEHIETLTALREAVPALEALDDETVLAFRALTLAAKSKHRYAGTGDLCAICGEKASDKTAHYQALTAGITEFTLVAAAGPGEPTRWVAPAIAVENQATEDGRILMPDSTTWRPGVLPLGVMTETPHGDMSAAPLCGGIDTFERIGPVISAGGYFNDNLDQAVAPDLVAAALQAIAGIESGTLTGISVDLMVMDGRMVEEASLDPDGEDELPPEVGDDLLYPSEVVEDDLDPEGRWLSAVYQGVIGGACIVPVPAIGNASISVVAAGSFERYILTSPLSPDCGCSDVPVHVNLTAAAAPLAPPKEWFENPGLGKPTPVTVTDDGRIYGHAALWNSCHEGYRGRCVPPPRSSLGYAKFHNGEMKCDDGSRVSVGKFTLAAGHAGVNGVTEAQAQAHYDNTATIGAFVRAGEDQHGIWIAGSLKSTLSPSLVVDLMASPPSGDWRNGEMVGVHAVIDPGFPVLRASGLGDLFDLEDEEVVEVRPVSALSYLRLRRKAVA